MILESQRRNFLLSLNRRAAAFQLRDFGFTRARELAAFPNPSAGIIRSDAARMIFS